MNVLALPSVLRQQPQQALPIDRSNPLTRGLIVVFIGSQSIDPISGKPFVNTTANNRTAGVMGLGVDGRIGQAKAAIAGPSISTGSMFVVVNTMDPTTEQIIAEIGPDGSFTAGVRGLRFVNGQFSAYVRNFYDILTPGTYGTNMPVPVGVTYAGASTSIYVNGQLATSGTTADTTSPASVFNLGGITGQTAYNVKGTIPVAFAWSRVLSAQEMAALAENPWQIFKAPARQVVVAALPAKAYVLPAAQGVYSITGNAAALRASRRMAAGVGAYALTGNAANLIRSTAGRALQAAGGSYAITGRAAALRMARRLSAAPGTYVVAGVATGSPVSGATPHYYDATIMRFSRLQAVATLGPDRLQQTTGFP